MKNLARLILLGLLTLAPTAFSQTYIGPTQNLPAGCNSTNFLRGDNTCQSVGGGTGTVTSVAAGSGLVASPSPVVSSGSISLDLAASNVFSGLPTYGSTEPRIKFNQTGAGTDQKLWDIDLASLVMCLRTRTDADGAGVNAICATRGSTTALTNISLGNATNNPTFTFLGTGSITVGGSILGQATVFSNVLVNGSVPGGAGIYRPSSGVLGFSCSTGALCGQIDGNKTLTTVGGQIEQIRVITASGAITMAVTDRHICVNKTTGAASAVGLVSTPATGTVVTVDDCKGDAATNNITITPAAGNIDGSANFVINANYGSWTGIYTGSIWKTEASR